MEIELGAATHVGRVREVNEDAVLADRHLAVVADGMGGHARGDLASTRTIEQFRALAAFDVLTPADVERAIAAANQQILDDVAEAPELNGMGTTVTGVALVQYTGQPHWLVFNIGDSRVYRISGGRVEQLTVDHSEVAELVALGRLTEEQAETHPLRHVITRSLGTQPAPTPDLWIIPADDDGDTFLACSDGLTNEIDDTRIARIVVESVDARHAAANLVDAALFAGGRDNITVAVLSTTPQSTHESPVATAPRGTIA